MSEEEWNIIYKFLDLCSKNDTAFFNDIAIYHKGTFNDTARGRRERFLIERER